MSFDGLTPHWFLELINIPLSVCTTVIHLPTEGQLGCFQLLAIMNKLSMNTCVQISV